MRGCELGELARGREGEGVRLGCGGGPERWRVSRGLEFGLLFRVLSEIERGFRGEGAGEEEESEDRGGERKREGEGEGEREGEASRGFESGSEEDLSPLNLLLFRSLGRSAAGKRINICQ